MATVTPNAGIDKTYTVEGFGLDRVHRPSDCITVPGGKGINVARVLKTLGRSATATGFLGGATGDAVARGLDAEGIAHDFVRIEGESRLCIAVMDPTTGTQTEINENGPEVTAHDVERALDKMRHLAQGKEYVVLCGSCPPGVPTSFYGDIIRIAQKAGARAVLDTSGEHLREAIKLSPYMVKPNVTELSQLAGRELVTLEEITRAAKGLRQYGVEISAVTIGRSGALLTDGKQVWKATPPTIPFASAVGSGDAFVAGFLDSLLGNQCLEEALAWATAAGAANATTYGAGFCSKDSIIEIREGVALAAVG